MNAKKCTCFSNEFDVGFSTEKKNCLTLQMMTE